MIVFIIGSKALVVTKEKERLVEDVLRALELACREISFAEKVQGLEKTITEMSDEAGYSQRLQKLENDLKETKEKLNQEVNLKEKAVNEKEIFEKDLKVMKDDCVLNNKIIMQMEEEKKRLEKDIVELKVKVNSIFF
jgi:hypothetical protein